ncbi:MAG TPA: hypothetical protein VF719_04565, partial [Abditibacteriaceae bacterium]
ARPEDALKALCAAAKLSWQVHNNIYIIGETSSATTSATGRALTATKKESKKLISLEFKDYSTAALLAAIGEQSGINVVLGSSIIDGEKISFIRLNNVMPEDALKEIAYAFDFESKKLNSDTYIIRNQGKVAS